MAAEGEAQGEQGRDKIGHIKTNKVQLQYNTICNLTCTDKFLKGKVVPADHNLRYQRPIMKWTSTVDNRHAFLEVFSMHGHPKIIQPGKSPAGLSFHHKFITRLPDTVIFFLLDHLLMR